LTTVWGYNSPIITQKQKRMAYINQDKKKELQPIVKGILAR